MTDKEETETTITEEKSTPIFSQFGRPFQEKIIQAMLVDKQWSSQFCELLKSEYFEFAYLKKFSQYYLDHQKKYKDFPSLDLMIEITKSELKNNTDGILKESIIDFIKKLKKNEDLGDLNLIKEKALDFCKRNSLKIALMESINLINDQKYETVVGVIKKAVSLGTSNTPGLNLSDDLDIECRYKENSRAAIPTGVPELDAKTVFNGGLGAGEIGVVVAGSGVGKSQVLVHFGAQAVLRGLNVLYYSFELNENSIGIRFDSHLLNLPVLDCYENKEKIRDYYKTNKDVLGQLRIKFFPTGTATTLQLMNHIEKLNQTGFKPDLLLIDYAGIMRSAERYDLLRLELKKIFEELRGMAGELNVPIWTAAQSNKEGINAEVMDITNMSESLGQSHICDIILGLSRKPDQKASGFGKLFVMKSRAGQDGQIYVCHLDCSRSKLRILNEQDVSESTDNNRNRNDSDGLGDYMKKAYARAQKRHELDAITSDLPFTKVQ